MSNSVQSSSIINRFHKNYVGKEVTRFENDVFGERFGIITDIIHDDYTNKPCAVVLWEDDIDVTYDADGYEVTEYFVPVHIIEMYLLQEGQMYEVHHDV